MPCLGFRSHSPRLFGSSRDYTYRHIKLPFKVVISPKSHVVQLRPRTKHQPSRYVAYCAIVDTLTFYPGILFSKSLVNKGQNVPGLACSFRIAWFRSTCVTKIQLPLEKVGWLQQNPKPSASSVPGSPGRRHFKPPRILLPACSGDKDSLDGIFDGQTYQAHRLSRILQSH